jgi:hypothetical protein
MPRQRRPEGFPRVTLKHIQRAEPKFFGWRVNVKRKGRGHVQYFADGPDGPFESLRAAIEWRDAVWERLGPPETQSSTDTRSTSGVVGVVHEVQRTSSGAIVETWRASWVDANGKRQRRAFSIDKFGAVEARERAIAARVAGVAETQKQRRRRMLDRVHIHKTMLRPKS